MSVFISKSTRRKDSWIVNFDEKTTRLVKSNEMLTNTDCKKKNDQRKSINFPKISRCYHGESAQQSRDQTSIMAGDLMFIKCKNCGKDFELFINEFCCKECQEEFFMHP